MTMALRRLHARACYRVLDLKYFVVRARHESLLLMRTQRVNGQLNS